jgi:hypothetical protein
MPTSYTTKSKVETYLGITISGSIDDWIYAVEAWIDKYLGRSYVSELATTKYYNSKGTKTLYIDDFSAITSITFLNYDGSEDITLTEDTDFYTYPYNETIKNKIILMPGGTRAAFPTGVKMIKIVANFGTTSIPKDIELAATMLTADIYNRSSVKGKLIQSESLGDYSATYGDIQESFNSLQVKNLLEGHRIFTL